MRMTSRICIVAALSTTGLAHADLARLAGNAGVSAKPSSGSDIRLTRLMPSYTLSFLASVDTPENRRAVAEQQAGAIHLESNQIFYAPLTIANGNPGGGLGPGGDGSVDTLPPPPPPPAAVPSPGAALLGLIGLTSVVGTRRRMPH